MADITLSKAVRSNLLNLQSTATQLGKTQERLATGLKVNSALDNPTNFFTASSLNSRAGDLGQLLDSVSNAVQTIAAADKGISAITKLVESAQANARQALQAPATVDTTTAAAAGTVAGTGTFAAVDVSGTGGPASAATVAGAAFTAPLDVSGAGSPATAGVVTSSGVTHTGAQVDATGGITFDISVDGGAAVTVTLSGTTGSGSTTANYTAADIQGLINTALTAQSVTVAASFDGSNNLVLTSASTGASSNVTVSNGAGGAATALGYTDGQSGTGAALVAADSISFALTIDSAVVAGGITIDDAARTTYNNDGANSAAQITNASSALTAADVVKLINYQAGAAVASINGTSGGIDITSTSTGTSSNVTIGTVTSGTTSGATGIAGGTDTGAALTTADSITFALSVDGAAVSGGITIDDAARTTYNAANVSTAITNASSALTAADIVKLVNYQAGAAVASVNGTTGAIDFTSTTTGTGSSITVGTVTNASSSGTSTITAGTDTGSDASTTSIANPQREVLRQQYNDVLTQIDQLAADTSFNGVNLLNGDSLSVLFNEDGTSSLDVTGVTFNAAGLGLTAIAANGFDTNTGINTTLDVTKTGIDTLRSQSSAFGSNLSVVETRQDFTKNIINVLETGAANLTLADSNEEAANLLALQTRQQLSSTALSLASQADQNVLRMF